MRDGADGVTQVPSPCFFVKWKFSPCSTKAISVYSSLMKRILMLCFFSASLFSLACAAPRIQKAAPVSPAPADEEGEANPCSSDSCGGEDKEGDSKSRGGVNPIDKVVDPCASEPCEGDPCND